MINRNTAGEGVGLCRRGPPARFVVALVLEKLDLRETVSIYVSVAGDPQRLARMASATIHTLSIRARARIPRAELLPIVDDAVATICGAEMS